MAWINTGAYVNGKRPHTKSTLRKALADNPGSVTFDVTSQLGPRAGEEITPDAIGADKLSVTGPDPYTARSWHATVSVSARTGKVTVT